MAINRVATICVVVVIVVSGCFSSAKETVDNLVQDPSLEDSSPGTKLPEKWQDTSSSESGSQCSVIEGGRTGSKCLEVRGIGKPGSVQIYRSTPESGQRYRGKCWVQFKSDPESTATLRLDYIKKSGEGYAPSEVSIKAADAGDGWHLLAVRDRLPESTASAEVSLSVVFSGTGSVEIDDAELVTDPSLSILRNLLPNGEAESVVGTLPVGWRMSKDGGDATWEASDERPFEGWHSIHLKGNVDWAVIGSDKVNVDRKKSYVLSGFIRTQSGSAQLKIDYFKGGEYLGSTESTGTYANEWKNEIVVWQPDRFPGADQITAAAVGVGEINAWFDKLVLQDQ